MNRYAGLVVLLLGLPAAGALAAEPAPDPAAVMARLATQRRDAARRTYEVSWVNYREGRASEDGLYRWSWRWLNAEKQLSTRRDDLIAAHRAHYERMRDLERLVRKLRVSGQTTIDEVSAAEYYRAEAELWLMQAKEEKKPR
jgi:hypothetical protein